MARDSNKGSNNNLKKTAELNTAANLFEIYTLVQAFLLFKQLSIKYECKTIFTVKQYFKYQLFAFTSKNKCSI